MNDPCKNIRCRWIPIVALLLASMTLLSNTSSAQQQTETKKKKFKDEEPIHMTLFCEPGWMITFRYDGQVKAQYGSGLGDNAYMPKGTIDFDELLKAAERLRSKEKVENSSQLVIVRFNSKDEKSSYAFYLKDDTLFRYLVRSYRSKWKSEINQQGFEKLLKQYPIYDK